MQERILKSRQTQEPRYSRGSLNNTNYVFSSIAQMHLQDPELSYSPNDLQSDVSR